MGGRLNSRLNGRLISRWILVGVVGRLVGRLFSKLVDNKMNRWLNTYSFWGGNSSEVSPMSVPSILRVNMTGSIGRPTRSVFG